MRTAVGVWMDRWKAPALARELLEQVEERAERRGRETHKADVQQRRAIDRRFRAHVLVAWDRYAWRAFVGAMALAGLLGLHPWGDRSIGQVAARVAVGVAVVIALGSLVERWYRSEHDR